MFNVDWGGGTFNWFDEGQDLLKKESLESRGS